MSKPTHRAFTVIEREGREPFWLNIGICFAHENGDGFNLLLQALPLDGKIVLRNWREDEEKEEEPNGKQKPPATDYKAKYKK